MFEEIKLFFKRMFHGSKLSLLSLQAYYHYKKLLLMPLFAALSFAIIFTSIVNLLLFSPDYVRQSETFKYAYAIIFMIVLFFGVAFIKSFFSFVTTFLLEEYCEKGRASVIRAIISTFSKIRFVIMWASLEALLRALSDKNHNNPMNSLRGFVARTSWRYISFFIYPVFAFEQKTLFESVKQSTNLMTTYFGTTSGSIFTFKVLGRLVMFVALGFAMLMQMILKVIPSIGYLSAINSKYGILFGLLPFFCTGLWFLFEFVHIAEVIVGTILYRYIHNQSTGIFNRDALEAATK